MEHNTSYQSGKFHWPGSNFKRNVDQILRGAGKHLFPDLHTLKGPVLIGLSQGDIGLDDQIRKGLFLELPQPT